MIHYQSASWKPEIVTKRYIACNPYGELIIHDVGDNNYTYRTKTLEDSDNISNVDKEKAVSLKGLVFNQVLVFKKENIL